MSAPNEEKRPPVIEMRPGGRGGPGARMNVQKPKNAKATLLRLVKTVGKNRRILAALLLVMLLSTLFSLVSPLLQGNAIDCIEPYQYAETENGRVIRFREGNETFVRGEDGTDLGLLADFEEAHPDTVFYTGVSVHLYRENYVGKSGETGGLFFFLLLLGVACGGSALLAFYQQRIAAKLSQYTVYTMRRDLFCKISSLPVYYTDRNRHGDLMSRMTNDVENVSNAVSQSIASLLSAVITIVGALGFMLAISWQLTLVALVTVPLTIFISGRLGKFMRRYFVRQQQLLGQLNGHVEEMVTSYKTVVAYGKEDAAVDRFAQTSEELRRCSIKARVWGSIMGPIMNFLGNLQYVLIAAFGGFFYLNFGLLSIGGIQSMLQYSKNFTRPINEVANQYSSILTALAGAERIFEVMDFAPEVDEGTRALPEGGIRGDISFEDVHFDYNPEKRVLKGLTLHVRAGQKIAIVGATGSGKTTIINLLTRFYEIDSGRITVDGIDIREIPKADLRREIGIVLQDTVLFRDTIRNNIKYGRLDAGDDEMERAAAVSKADLFIGRLPDGYDTELSEGGSNLSQGQRQLLAITRAIIADPKILILDEATSNVDTRTEMDIQAALIHLMKNRTSLIIAHRLSTIRDADCIVVLKGGVIAEAGSHEELLAKGGEYSKLYQTQFAGIAT